MSPTDPQWRELCEAAEDQGVSEAVLRAAVELESATLVLDVVQRILASHAVKLAQKPLALLTSLRTGSKEP